MYMVNTQFLCDVCDGDMGVYYKKARDLRHKHRELLDQLNRVDIEMGEMKEIIQKIINDVYDLILYGSNVAYKIAYDNIKYIDKYGRCSSQLMERLFEFDIIYYLVNHNIYLTK